jgi:4-amino-4-deoxy-L-arabinose transferase-like glycosyltransferase
MASEKTLSPMKSQSIDHAFPTDKVKSSFLLGKSGLVVLFLTVLGLVLRLPNLGESFWLDEVLYSTSYLFSSLSDLWYLFLHDPPAPLYRVLLFFWMNIFGETELSVRVPSLLFGISSIGLTYGIARAYCSPRVAFLAAALLCVSPAHVWYSQEATPYAMTLFFFLAAVLAWLRLREMPSHKGWYAVYFGMLLLAVFTHYFAAVLLVPLTLLSLTLESSLRRRIMVAHVVVVMSLALALGVKYQLGQVKSGQEFLRPFSLFEWWMLYFNWFLQGNALWTVSPYRANIQSLLSEPLFLVCQMFFCIIFLRGLLSYRGQEAWAQTWELCFFIVSLPLVMFLLTQVGYRHLYIERYLFLILPFFLIVLARGAASFTNAKAVIACSAAAVVLGVASYGALLYKSDRWTVYKQNPDWRSAAHYFITQSIPAEEALIFATISPVELVYYFPEETPFPNILLYKPQVFERILTRTRLKAFYLLKNNYWVAGADKVLQRLKDDERLELINSQSFKGVEIYTFVRQGTTVD